MVRRGKYGEGTGSAKPELMDYMYHHLLLESAQKGWESYMYLHL